MVLDMIVSELASLQNLALIAVLIALFLVGYKLMQTLIQTGLIAILSGVFLVALNIVGLGPEITISRFLTFMVLGIALYMLYSSISMLNSVLSFVWGFIKKIFNLLRTPFKNSGSSTSTSSSRNSKEKEVILKEVDD